MRCIASRRWSRREARRRVAPPAALLLDAEDILLQPDDQGNTEAYFVQLPSSSCSATHCSPCGGKANSGAGWAVDYPLSIKVEGEKYFYLRDSLGSIVGLVDDNENVVNEYDYDAFGNIVYSSEDVQQPYKFTAREYDDETGQYYYRARTYLPETGRFAQQDPLGMVDGTNMYVYCGENPVNRIDPKGYASYVGFSDKNYEKVHDHVSKARTHINNDCYSFYPADFCDNLYDETFHTTYNYHKSDCSWTKCHCGKYENGMVYLYQDAIDESFWSGCSETLIHYIIHEVIHKTFNKHYYDEWYNHHTHEERENETEKRADNID